MSVVSFTLQRYLTPFNYNTPFCIIAILNTSPTTAFFNFILFDTTWVPSVCGSVALTQISAGKLDPARELNKRISWQSDWWTCEAGQMFMVVGCAHMKMWCHGDCFHSEGRSDASSLLSAPTFLHIWMIREFHLLFVSKRTLMQIQEP